MIRAASSLAREARTALRVGVFGGSFDPPHVGHRRMARAAFDGCSLEHLIWIPAARPPHKEGRELAAGADRARMIELMLAEDPLADGPAAESIWTVELERSGPSYTVDTLRQLVPELAPRHELHLLVGTDNLPGLGSWREIDAILALARPIVLPRTLPGEAAGDFDLEACLGGLSEASRARVRAGLLDCPRINVGSTALRERLADGGDPGDALLPSVRAYIREAGLYRAG